MGIRGFGGKIKTAAQNPDGRNIKSSILLYCNFDFFHIDSIL